MMLTIQTYRTRKSDGNPVYKAYRFACFDTNTEFQGMEFQDKFNKAYDILKEEINQDRLNNDMTIYDTIQITNCFLS